MLGVYLALLTVGVFVVAGNASVAAAACQAPSPSYGNDTLTISVPSSGTYYLWVRMESPAAGDNTILLQVDTASCYNMGGASNMPANSWTWVNYQNGATGSALTASFPQGTHTLTLLGNAPGVSADRIELLADGNCVPSGAGDNCIPIAITPNPSPSPSPGSSNPPGAGTSGDGGTSITASAPINFQPTPNLADGELVKAQYFLDKRLVATVTSAPFSYRLDTTNLANGTYTFTTKLYYRSGAITTSTQRLVVRNPLSLKQLMLLTRKYILPIVVGFLAAVGAALYLFRWVRRRQGQEMAADDLSGGGTPPVYGNPEASQAEVGFLPVPDRVITPSQWHQRGQDGDSSTEQVQPSSAPHTPHLHRPGETIRYQPDGTTYQPRSDDEERGGR